jgi:hypothetical protein
VPEDLPDHRRVLDAGNHPDLATALLAALDLDTGGLGTKAASRAMKSSGSNTTCVVPSRYGVFSV